MFTFASLSPKLSSLYDNRALGCVIVDSCFVEQIDHRTRIHTVYYDVVLTQPKSTIYNLPRQFTSLIIRDRVTILDGKSLPLTWIWNIPSTCLGSR